MSTTAEEVKPHPLAELPTCGLITPRYDAPNHESIVYYIANQGYEGVIKIGVTNSISRRMYQMRLKKKLLVPRLLAYEVGDYWLEQKRHRQFAGSCLQGEWFWVTPDLEEHILDVCS